MEHGTYAARVRAPPPHRYYAPDVHFRHPVCEANDRKSLLSIFQWYRIMSPSHTLDVGSVTYNRDKLEVFLDITQTFHLRWSPLSPGPARCVSLALSILPVFPSPSFRSHSSFPPALRGSRCSVPRGTNLNIDDDAWTGS